jgi:hypothetical protein
MLLTHINFGELLQMLMLVWLLPYTAVATTYYIQEVKKRKIIKIQTSIKLQLFLRY